LSASARGMNSASTPSRYSALMLLAHQLISDDRA
jgi:hypothetical protein